VLNVGDAGFASPTAYNVPSGANSSPITFSFSTGAPNSVACPVLASMVASCCGPGVMQKYLCWVSAKLFGPQTLYNFPSFESATDVHPYVPIGPIGVIVTSF
jgi:hypothetical protein